MISNGDLYCRLTKQAAVKVKADRWVFFCSDVKKGVLCGICADNEMAKRVKCGNLVFQAELKAKVNVLRHK